MKQDFEDIVLAYYEEYNIEGISKMFEDDQLFAENYRHNSIKNDVYEHLKFETYNV
jgi:hypothetical protein